MTVYVQSEMLFQHGVSVENSPNFVNGPPMQQYFLQQQVGVGPDYVPPISKMESPWELTRPNMTDLQDKPHVI